MIIFLTLWLRAAYQDEKKALAQEMNLLFLRSLRNTERNVLNFSPQQNSVQIRKIDIKSDTILQEPRSEIKVMVIDSRNQLDSPNGKILIDRKIDFGQKADSTTVNATFLRNFDTLFQKANLPFKYELKHIDEKDENNKIFLTFDKIDEKHNQLALQSTDYQWYLAKKMIPHTLFALLLLGAVSISFWLMYRNAAMQNKLLAQKKCVYQQCFT